MTIKDFFDLMFSLDRRKFDNYIDYLVQEKSDQTYKNMKADLEKNSQEIKILQQKLRDKTAKDENLWLEFESLRMIQYEYEKKYPERYVIDIETIGVDHGDGDGHYEAIPGFKELTTEELKQQQV